MQSAYIFASDKHPESSVPGIAWLTGTLIAMLLLAAGERFTGTLLGNPVLVKEGYGTLIDAFLAASVLTGLALNVAFGFWWADPLAGLVVVYYGLKEGREALHHE